MALQDNKKQCFSFDELKLEKLPATDFKWPEEQYKVTDPDELDAPLIDLDAFQRGDEEAISKISRLVHKACSNHGFFQVINHGVDSSLIDSVYKETSGIFEKPVERKSGYLPQKLGSILGYSCGHAYRFSSMLVWKETYTSPHPFGSNKSTNVVDFVKSALGPDFESSGYCEELERLAGVIFEVLAVSLGLEDRYHLKKYFEDGRATLRHNYYPKCEHPDMVFGTSAHSDPISLTILHQDQVGGLEVLSDNKWLAVKPQPNAFVINIGDTLMALLNGNYKSCLHRALVNNEKARYSIVFFVSPKEDKVVKPPEELVQRDGGRKYPDFTWSELFDYINRQRRIVDGDTLPNFAKWIVSSKE